MTDNRAAAEAALGDSTVLDAGQHAENPISDAAFDAEQQPEPVKEAPKGPTTREAIAKALEEQEAKDKAEADKKDEKPADKDAKAEKDAKAAKDGEKTDAKPEKAAEQPDDKGEKRAAPEKDDAGTGQDGAEKSRQSEGRQFQEPPARFLPEAREKWGPTPHVIKAEMHRIMAEVDEREQQTKQATEAYESIKQYDEMAKTSGTTLKEALARFVNAETLLRQNPVQGIAAILQQVGITPEQYAKHVMANPQAHKVQPQAMPQQPQQPQRSPEIDQLRAEIASLRAEQTVGPIIQRFASDHPDYETLQPKIVAVLEKDATGKSIIDKLYGTGLSPEQKLAEAYRMVGGRPAPSRSDPDSLPENSQSTPDPQVDPAGQKSIKGAPSAGFDPAVKRPKSNRDAAASALAELGL